MTRLLDNPKFAAAYARLANVTLNPRRHTASNAHAHSEAVAARAASLALANGVDTALLEDLGRAHDIGKITGTARPEKSLDVLADYIGPNKILWATDYPHADGFFPGAPAMIANRKALSEKTKRGILAGGATAFYGLA